MIDRSDLYVLIRELNRSELWAVLVELEGAGVRSCSSPSTQEQQEQPAVCLGHQSNEGRG